MLKICLVFWKSEPKYAYKRYACKKKTCNWLNGDAGCILFYNLFYFRVIKRKGEE